MEYLEDTQDFDLDSLPYVVPLDSGEIIIMTKVMNLFLKEVKS